MKIPIIAAIVLTAIAVIGLNFAGAFASVMPSAISATPQGSPMMTVPPTAIIPIQSHWVRIVGDVNTWGTQDVSGTITVMSATTSINGVPTNWLDSATALWTNTTNYREDGNISYSYYAARLVKANFTSTDFQGNNFYMNGTWSVANVTFTRTVIKTDSGAINVQTNTNIAPLETKVYGELNVTGGWTQFTLSITGIPLLSGVVDRQVERLTMLNRFDITSGGTAATVTRADLTTIAHDYGAVPGMSNYDESMDFHGTYQIDICDLSTVAANVQP